LRALTKYVHNVTNGNCAKSHSRSIGDPPALDAAGRDR
jgi:hypothetical protein